MSPSLGIWLSSASWDVELALKSVQLDWVVADCQHGNWSQRELEQLFSGLGQGVNSVCRPLVRTGLSPSVAEVGRFLDAGAWGLIVPSVEGIECINSVQSCMRYPPRGVRSLARNVGVLNSQSGSLDQYVKWSNEALTVLAIIETEKGLENLHAISDVCDGVLFGLRDLSLHMGENIENCLALIEHQLKPIRGKTVFGYLGIEHLQQSALGAGIINLGNPKDFVLQAIKGNANSLKSTAATHPKV